MSEPCLLKSRTKVELTPSDQVLVTTTQDRSGRSVHCIDQPKEGLMRRLLIALAIALLPSIALAHGHGGGGGGHGGGHMGGGWSGGHMGGGWSGGHVSGGMSSRAAVGGARVGAWNGSRSARGAEAPSTATAGSCIVTAESSSSAADHGGSAAMTAAGDGFRRRGDRVASGPATTSNGQASWPPPEWGRPRLFMRIAGSARRCVRNAARSPDRARGQLALPKVIGRPLAHFVSNQSRR